MPYKGFQKGRWFECDESDTEYLKQNATEAILVAPRNQLGGHRGSNNVIRGRRMERLMFMVMPDIFKLIQ